jgi:nitrite reductase/ring-hydroxylating ferredoxin subunit
MRDRKYKICANTDLAENDFKIVPLHFRKKPLSGIIFRYKQKLYAYVNQCVHLPRKLNCEANTIFDESKMLLRCSMHGMVFQPETGESVSTSCNGERLQPIRLKVHRDIIYIDDKHVSAVKSLSS